MLVMGQHQTDHKGFGNLIRNRLENRGKSQMDLASEMNISQAQVSNVLKGTVDIGKQRISFFEALVGYLGITQADFDRFGVYYPSNLFGSNFAQTAPSRRFPVRHFANGSQPIDSDSHIDISDQEAKYLLPSTEFGQMVGDSMLDPSNPTAEWSLRDGDKIWINTNSIQLKEGYFYLIHLPTGGKTVKELRKLEGEWWCFSNNEFEGHLPFRLPEAHEIIGEVYYKQPRGHQIKRRHQKRGDSPQ
jgi:transcriptional regulator with XRE-family HTH domain